MKVHDDNGQPSDSTILVEEHGGRRSLGRSIRIYLDSGEVSGIRHAELVNWTGQAVLCPRSRFKELLRWERETRRPGVYFLIGAEQLTAREVYIGESESVFDRLDQHLERDFWQEAVVFTSKDENLTKAHVRYLESRLIEIASKAGRYNVTNKNGGGMRISLPRADTDAMEEFLIHARLILGALGHRLLDPIAAAASGGLTRSAEKDQARPLEFFYGIKDAQARGTISDDGFIVFKGSTALKQSNKSLQGGYEAIRQELLMAGKLKVRGELLEFVDDVLFNSPTAAAAVICGNGVNGRMSWKLRDGRSLKSLEEEQVKQVL